MHLILGGVPSERSGRARHVRDLRRNVRASSAPVDQAGLQVHLLPPLRNRLDRVQRHCRRVQVGPFGTLTFDLTTSALTADFVEIRLAVYLFVNKARGLGEVSKILFRHCDVTTIRDYNSIDMNMGFIESSISSLLQK